MLHFDVRCSRWLSAALLLGAALSCKAEPRLFLPVITEPSPGPLVREVQILDAGSGEVLGTMLRDVNIKSMEMSSDGSRFFFAPATEGGEQRVAVYKVATGAVETIETPITHPTQLILDEPNDRVFVVGPFQDRVAVLDLASFEVLRVLEFTDLPSRIRRVVLDASRDRLYLGLGREVRVVDAVTAETLDSEPVPAFLKDIFLDSQRDRLYYSAGGRAFGVLSVTSDGIEPYAIVEFDQRLDTLLLEQNGDRLYASTETHSGEPGTYAIAVDSIPAGSSDWERIDADFLSLPRAAPVMQLDPVDDVLYLIQDFASPPGPPPFPPSDPMTIFVVEPASFTIQETFETEFGGPFVQRGAFLTRVDGPNGVVGSEPIPGLHGLGAWILAFMLSTAGVLALRARAGVGAGY